MVQTDDSVVGAEGLDGSVFFQNQTKTPTVEEIHCVEWNSSTKALADFLAAFGVADPGRKARYLLEKFGNLSSLLEAPWWRLRLVVGGRLTRAILSSRGVMTAMLEEQINDGPLVCRSKELVELLQAEVGFLDHERLLALFVDSKCRLMRIERIADGSFNEVRPNYRAVIGSALAIGAAGFILVHNHPSGDPQPSNSDIAFTERLRDLARSLNLELLDHLIVARGQFGTIYDFWREARWAERAAESSSEQS